MGLFDIFTRPVRITAATESALPVRPLSPLVQSSSSFAQVVWSEFFAGEVAEVTRESALMIPALKRARDIICSQVATMSLRQFAGDTDVTPDWLMNSKSGVSPYHRMVATVDDILFYDWSLWAVERDGDNIVDAIRVPFDRWSVDEWTGVVAIDDVATDPSRVILIPGAGSGGVLQNGAQLIKGYKAMERSWVGRTQNPVPLIELHQVSDDQLTDGSEDPDDNEVADLINAWSVGRTSPTGAVGFTDNRVEVRVHGAVQTDLFVEGRNAAVLDVARLVGMPGSLLDGSMATASLTYVTTEGKRSEFDVMTTPLYVDPIESRLSLDDVAPEGQVIRFDRSDRVAVQAEPIRSPKED